MHQSLNGFKIRSDRTIDYVLAALGRLRKKIPYTYNGENNVITCSRLFLIKSCSYLQVMRTCIKAWMSMIELASNF